MVAAGAGAGADAGAGTATSPAPLFAEKPCSPADSLLGACPPVCDPPPAHLSARPWSLPSPSPSSSPLPSPPPTAIVASSLQPPERLDAQSASTVGLPASAAPAPTPAPPLRPRPGLRLPSFDMLGIAFPHPAALDRDLPRASSRLAREARIHEMSVSLAAEGLPVPLKLSAAAAAAVLTPPEEAQSFTWRSPRHASTVESAASLAQHGSPKPKGTGGLSSPTWSLARDAAAAASAPVVVPLSENTTSLQQQPDAVSSPLIRAHLDNGAAACVARPRQLSIPALDDALGWLAPSVMAIASCIGGSGGYAGSLKILSHALPAPSVPGHVYANIIDAIRAQCEPGQLAWINLMHAIPGRLNLAELPTSPPSTPAPPLDGDDYFTTQVFSSAVPTGDDEIPGGPVVPRRAAERLLSPPGSVDLAIIERYIPPSSQKEVQNMFSLESPSILVDRLVELSTNGGCLTLIYPTKVGGQAFVRDHLEPNLDPLLRTMMSLHGLSMDFGGFVSDASMANRLLEFPLLQVAIEELCERVSRRHDALLTRRFHGIKSSFRVVYSEARTVHLDSEVWANWWVRQEKGRLASAINRYFQNGCRAPRDERAQSGVLLQEVLDGVRRKAASGQAVSAGIEVGVFVIKRE